MRSKIIARNSLFSAADRVFSLISSFVTVILVARVLGPENLGHYSYIMWIVGVTTVVGHFGVPHATRKYVAEFLGKGDVATAKAVIRHNFRLQLATALILIATGITISLLSQSPEHQTYTIIALLSILPTMLLAIPSNVHFAIEDFSSNVIPSAIGEVVNFVGVLMVLWLDGGLVGLSAALLFARMVDSAIRYYIYRTRFPEYLAKQFGYVPPAAPAIPVEVRQRMIRFCWQATGLLVLNLVVWDRSEVFFLKHFSDVREVAFYSMSFGIMKALSDLPRSFGVAAGANLMAQHGRDPKPLPYLVSTTVRYQALIVLPLALGMAALSSPAVQFLYGSQYEPAIPVLAIVALFSVPSALMLSVRQLLTASEHQGFLLRWGIVTAILNLSLDWWWIPAGGAIGAALANGVSQTVSATGIWVFALRRFPVRFPWLPLLKVAFSAVTMAALVAGIAQFLDPAPATVVGVMTGLIAFLVLLRWTRCLEPADGERLSRFQEWLPSRLRTWYVFGIQMVVTRT